MSLGCSSQSEHAVSRTTKDAANAASSDAGGANSVDGPTLTTAPISLEPGGERLLVCQSFVLNNEDWLYFSGVHFASVGVHHSNWFVMPEGAYPGPSGSADCQSFGFGVLSDAAPVQSGLLFSQSTEVADETETFGDGAAYAVPPHSQVFLSYHVLNTSSDTLDVGVTATTEMLREEDVKVRLTAGGALLGLLAIPPDSRARFSANCSFASAPDFKGYYALPHYHNYGVGMQVQLIGGPRDGETVWQAAGPIGEAVGTKFEQPVDFSGATGFRFSCDYVNTTSNTILGGSYASDEMCGFAMGTDAAQQFYGVATPGFGTPTLVDDGTDASGQHQFHIDGCAMLQ
ncbi:MAG TPA: hypothetical protein VH062_04965 [Polyangiaceae bacterium]|nr:hypothetical protein [Polyangiaceae bacterium]